MTTWTALPRLARGSHHPSSGKACLMNAISIGQGDATITDMPACTHPVLARAAQQLNDTICAHRVGEVLCLDCTVTLLGYEPQLVGTGVEDPALSARLSVVMAVALRPLIESHWTGSNRQACAAAFDTAQAWLDGDATREQCTAAGYAAATAAYAAGSTAAATTAAEAAATAAYAAAGVAAAAYAAEAAGHAAGVATARGALDAMLTAYYREAGRPRPHPLTETDAQRITRDLHTAGVR